MIPQHIEEKIKNTRFLVTGGAGFIGANIVDKLLSLGARKVTVLDDLSTGNSANLSAHHGHPAFEFIERSICDYDSCLKVTKEIDVVLHQAALGSVPRSINNPLATHRVNVDGFLNVLNATRENAVGTFVYASSSSVYGDDRSMPKKEALTGNLLSPYAVSKQTNEAYARVFARVYGMRTIGLRYFNVFGPYQSIQGPYAAVIPLFIRAMQAGQSPTIFGTGETTRDFTFVSNVVQANIRAAFSAPAAGTSPVYNVAFGGTTSLNELFRILARYTGFNRPPVYGPERTGDIRDSWADISLAMNQLGYTPETGLEEGLKITVDWFRQHPAGDNL